jgi:hypothetical protein
MCPLHRIRAVEADGNRMGEDSPGDTVGTPADIGEAVVENKHRAAFERVVAEAGAIVPLPIGAPRSAGRTGCQRHCRLGSCDSRPEGLPHNERRARSLEGSVLRIWGRALLPDTYAGRNQRG